MKRSILLLLLFASLNCFSGFAQYTDKYIASLPTISIGLDGGVLNTNRTHPCFGVYLNIVGLTISGDMVTDTQDDEPDFYEVLFGYQFPIATNYHKKEKGYALYFTPMIGALVEDVSYNTIWGTEDVEYREKSLAYGCIVSYRFGGSTSCQVNLKVSNNGFSAGLAWVLGK